MYAPPGLSCTMGMSALRAVSSSPMSALRSTAAVDTITSAGTAAAYERMPPSTSSLNWPGLQSHHRPSHFSCGML